MCFTEQVQPTSTGCYVCGLNRIFWNAPSASGKRTRGWIDPSCRICDKHRISIFEWSNTSNGSFLNNSGSRGASTWRFEKQSQVSLIQLRSALQVFELTAVSFTTNAFDTQVLYWWKTRYTCCNYTRHDYTMLCFTGIHLCDLLGLPYFVEGRLPSTYYGEGKYAKVFSFCWGLHPRSRCCKYCCSFVFAQSKTSLLPCTFFKFCNSAIFSMHLKCAGLKLFVNTGNLSRCWTIV